MAYKTVETRLHVWMLLDSIDLVPDSEPKCWENRTIRYPTQIYGRPNEAARSAHSDSTFSLAFGYVQGALVLPDTAEARFLSIFNTTLIELPQGPNARAGASPGRLQPDIFALLLWCITRYDDAWVGCRGVLRVCCAWGRWRCSALGCLLLPAQHDQ